MSNVALTWAGEGTQMFVGRDSFGHVVVSGSWPSDEPDWQEWKAVKPSDLLLLSLASCTAYDMVMILGRQRQQMTSLQIKIDSQQQKDPPYAFTDIHVHYLVRGNDLDSARVNRAAMLSQEKYCSVAATIRGVAELTYSVEVD